MANKTHKIEKDKLSLKFYLMNAAHIIDVFRVIPRIMVTGYGYLVWDSVQWFQALPDPTNAHTFLISTIVGGAAAVFGLYVNSGASWDDLKSSNKQLYIQSGANGSSFQNTAPGQHRGYQQPRSYQQRNYTQQQGGDLYPRRHQELEMPTRRRGEQEVNETPPEGFYDEN